MQLELLKLETQSVQVCLIYTPFKYNQTQFRRVEVPSVGNHMFCTHLSESSYGLERTISYSNLTCKHWNEEKTLKSTNEYFK